jgi:2',3'-cyclic-nucleotide 2'-phosphodiesterase (5'-nucleotidase family)
VEPEGQLADDGARGARARAPVVAGAPRPPRLLPAVLAALALALFARAARPDDPAPAGAPADPWVSLVVLHTNDVHGGLLPRPPDLAGIDAKEDVGGVAALASFVAHERAEAAARGAHVLLLDGGDVWRGTPEGDLPRGSLVVEAFSRLAYDAVALGNHELDLGRENAERLAKAARFPWLSANVVDSTTKKHPDWLRPSVVVERGGLRIGVIGLSPPDTGRLVISPEKLGLEFLPEVESAKAAAADLEGKADVLLFVTHLGPDRDLRVLDAVPRAPLVVGGHTHTRLARPIPGGPQKKSWVVQAGTGCVLAGRVRMRVRRDTKETSLDSYDLVPLIPSQVGSDEATTKFLAERTAAIPELKGLSEVVATLSAPLERNVAGGVGTTPAGNLVTDAMRAAAQADVAMTNRGGIRLTLPAGPVTRRAMHMLLPFENTLVRVPMTGAEIRASLQTSIGGQGITFLEVSGLEVRYAIRAEGGVEKRVVTSVSVDGTPLDEAKTYRVATNSFLAGGGDGYAAFRKEGHEDLGRILRDVVTEWLKAHGDVGLERGSRIRYENAPGGAPAGK